MKKMLLATVNGVRFYNYSECEICQENKETIKREGIPKGSKLVIKRSDSYIFNNYHLVLEDDEEVK